MRLIDQTGRTFGRLTVLERGENTPTGKVRWVCRCECGRIALVWADSLRTGMSRSCGCLQKEWVTARNTTHGHAMGGKETKGYLAWHDAKHRCFNPRNKQYRNYGGRGITMAAEWVNDVAAFLAHIGPAPGPEYSVDRINNDGHYEPGNVRWATPQEQRANQRPRRRRQPA